MFVSVDGKAREVKEIFAGGTDGLAHKVKEVFGSVDGTANTIFTDSPYPHNAFNDFTWAEIKQLADEGRLLEYFNKYDVVDIKLKEPLVGYPGTDSEYYQDRLPMTVSQIGPNGMQLVARISTPLTWRVTPINIYLQKIMDSCQEGHWTTVPDDVWATFEGMYDACKAVTDRLPDDMAEVCNNHKALIQYEYGYDEEGKYKLMSKYDNKVKVRQVSTCDFEYDRVYNEEKDRMEYRLLKSFYDNHSKAAYFKFVPEDVRAKFYDGDRYQVNHFPRTFNLQSLRYRAPYPNYPAKFNWYVVFSEAVHGWKWDWENWNGINQLGMNGSPIIKMESGTVNFDTLSWFVPEVTIGTPPEIDQEIVE